MTFHYRVFGLTFASERPIPALAGAQTDASDSVDVTIVEKALPALENGRPFIDMFIARKGDACLIDVPEVGLFSARKESIVFDRFPGASDVEVDSYLLGSAFGAVLHMRGIVPLHSNGVICNGKAVLVCGASGAGKSTLAARFVRAGLAVLTDDLCALDMSTGDGVRVHSGIPRLKLWESSLAHLQMDRSGARGVPWAEGKFELTNDAAPLGAYPVAAIFVLPITAQPDRGLIEKVGTLAALNAITSNIYRRVIADVMGTSRNYLATSTRLADQVPIMRINRQWGLENFEAEACQLISQIETVTAEKDQVLTV